jgi:putative nucleotidyltransferase with HDIG domain
MADLEECGQAKAMQFRIFRKNGELCYLQCGGAVELDEHGKPARFIGTAQDVTERRLADIQIKQQIKRLTALSEIDRTVLSSFDQKHILDVILSYVISELQVDAAAVLLSDAEGASLCFAAGQGFRTATIEATQLRIGESQAGRAAKERRMVRIPDVRELRIDLSFQTIMEAEGFVGYMGVPLIVKGKVKGVLEVFQRAPLRPYQEWLDFFNALAGQTAIAIENSSLLGTLQATNQELLQAYDATIEGWSRAMDLRDRETAGHTQRVTELTLDLARALGVSSARRVHIRRGALLHDIGKLGVPDHILFKPGRLTEEEWAIMRQHTDLAYDMLSPIQYLKPALAIPYFHHERWDGTGYPLGLKGDQIPLEARIFAIVDVWDALHSDRPYRKAFTRQETIEYMRSHAGSQFDPRVVEVFLEMMERTNQ